ncbi:YDG domain-containing protein [Mycena chlorophos]|uniref:YDG domain-containing protein n=1 Tax=Mycena chlorophos TaxID=658473 RepID=A0A8H6TNG5_MYCCL|nr:YDG domain-containing protein [Mycena chlorophos]
MEKAGRESGSNEGRRHRLGRRRPPRNFFDALPNELLSEIFLHYIPPYPYTVSFAGPGSPTYLCGICRRWRDVAIANPQLWRAFEFLYGQEEKAELALAWLERSSPCLIAITIDFLAAEDGLPPRAAKVLDAIIANRTRWGHIDFYLPLPVDISRCAGLAPHLSDLTLMVNYPLGQGDEEEPKFDAFTDVPCLRKLQLGGLGHDISTFPWTQITTLGLYYVQLALSASSLQQCLNLVECKLLLQDVFPEVDELFDITLPRVKVFVLLVDHPPREVYLDPDSEAGEWIFDEDLLQHFTLPGLERLLVSDLLLSVGVHEIEALVERSKCKLSKLQIARYRWYHERGTELAAQCAHSEIFFEVDVWTRTVVRGLDETARWATEPFWDCSGPGYLDGDMTSESDSSGVSGLCDDEAVSS